LALTGICPLIAWRRASKNNLKKNFYKPGIFGILVGVILFMLGIRHPYALISFSLSGFVVATIVLEFYRGTRARRDISGRNWLSSLFDLIGRNKRRYGGYIIHLGVILLFIGATGKAFVVESKTTLEKGQTFKIKDYIITYQGLSRYESLNRLVVAALLDVQKGSKSMGTITPQKRFYQKSDEPTTEVAILSSLKEDLYVILAGYDENSASFKFIVNPLMVWLWIGGVVMTLGSLIVIWQDKRKKTRQVARHTQKEEVKTHDVVV
jgi:cytochrome c-type biogenesis protein CcmF